MYRSGSRYQEWSVSGHVSVAAPVRLPKFVRSRSAQYRLKTYGPSKPTAIIKPFPAFSAVSSEVWEKLGVVKTEFEWSSLVSKEIRKHDKKERIPELTQIAEKDEEESRSAEDIASMTRKATDNVAGDVTKHRVTDLEFQLKNLENQMFAQQSHLHITREELMRRNNITETLEREKKQLQELLKKSKDNHHSAEVQLQTAAKSRDSHEQNCQLARNAFEHEKSLKQNLERENRRLEHQVIIKTTLIQETESLKKELQLKLYSKQDEFDQMFSKLESEQQVIVKLREEIKKFQEKITQLEQQYAQESQARNVAEQTEAGLRNELDKLNEKLEKLLTDYALQVDVNRQRELELTKVKHDYGKATSQHEVAMSSMKDKYTEQITSLEEQITLIQAEKMKLEKSKVLLQQELADCTAQIESLTKEKSNMEVKKNRMETKAFEYQLRIEEQNGLMAELAGQKQKLVMENGKLLQQLADAEVHLSTLESKKHELQRQLDEETMIYDKTCEERNFFKDQARHMTNETEQLRIQLELNEEERNDITRQLNRSNTERDALHSKLNEFELLKATDMEEQKNYYERKLSQVAEENDTLTTRVYSLEKIRMHLKNDVDDLQQALENANTTVFIYEKKIKAYEKSFEEWERKCNDLMMEVAVTHEENHVLSSMAEKLQRYLAEAGDQINSLTAENDKLREELRTVNAELSEANDRVRDAENQRRRIAEENEALNKSLNESEVAMTEKVEKISKMQKEIDNFNTIVEERLAEKAAEFEVTRKTLKQTIDSLHSNLEDEIANKTEVIKQKRIVEHKLSELEVLLEQANQYRLEAHEHVKRLQEENKNLNINLQASQQKEKDLIEKLSLAEKRANVMQTERDEIVATLRQVEAARKDLETKVAELDLKLAEKSADVEFLSVSKRKFEIDILNLQSEMEFTSKILYDAERKTTEAELEVVKVKDSLVHEQQSLSKAEQTKRDLETRIIELENQIESMERDAAASVEKAVAKVQQQVVDLESELKTERRKHIETQKQEKHAEKQSKELQFLLNEEKQRGERMAELVETLERKLQVFKRQREDAEQMATINLTRCRTLRSELGGASERADAAEQVLTKIRAESKARVLGVMTNGISSYSSTSRSSSVYSSDKKFSSIRSVSSVR